MTVMGKGAVKGYAWRSSTAFVVATVTVGLFSRALSSPLPPSFPSPPLPRLLMLIPRPDRPLSLLFRCAHSSLYARGSHSSWSVQNPELNLSSPVCPRLCLSFIMSSHWPLCRQNIKQENTIIGCSRLGNTFCTWYSHNDTL